MPNHVSWEQVCIGHCKHFIDGDAFRLRRVIVLGTCCGYTKASSPNDGVRVSAYQDAGAVNTVSTIRWSAMHNVIGCSQDVACEVKGGQRYMAAQTHV